MARSTGGWPYRFAGKQKRGERSETAIIKTRYLLEQTFPFLGERPLAEIKAPEVLAVLKHLERKGMLEIGKSVRDTIGAVLL